MRKHLPAMGDGFEAAISIDNEDEFEAEIFIGNRGNGFEAKVSASSRRRDRGCQKWETGSKQKYPPAVGGRLEAKTYSDNSQEKIPTMRRKRGR